MSAKAKEAFHKVLEELASDLPREMVAVKIWNAAVDHCISEVEPQSMLLKDSLVVVKIE